MSADAYRCALFCQCCVPWGVHRSQVRFIDTLPAIFNFVVSFLGELLLKHSKDSTFCFCYPTPTQFSALSHAMLTRKRVHDRCTNMTRVHFACRKWYATHEALHTPLHPPPHPIHYCITPLHYTTLRHAHHNTPSHHTTPHHITPYTLSHATP